MAFAWRISAANTPGTKRFSMGQYLDDNLSLLKKKLDSMGYQVQDSIAQVLEALLVEDTALADQIIDNETAINRLEAEIDDLVLKLLALQHPTAVDLRFVITGMKITNDLERMGDQACKIARTIVNEADQGRTSLRIPLVNFDDLGTRILAMVRNCIRAYTTDDLALARSIIVDDRSLGAVVQDSMQSLVRQIHEHTTPPAIGLAQIHVVRNLARLGDLTTSVAKNVIFYVEGKVETGEVPGPAPLSDSSGLLDSAPYQVVGLNA
jgi:phosphate transport system protein